MALRTARRVGSDTGTIVCMHVSEAVLGADGFIDPRKLDTIGRMGGDYYTRTTELFTIQRPR